MSRIESLGKCLVERYGLTRKDAESFVSEMFAVIRDSLEKERVVKVKGLGTFKLADMNPRESVDVNTGERILIEGRAKVSFTPENAVRDRINSPFAQFETVEIGDDVDFSDIDDKYSTAEEPEEQPERVQKKEPEPEVARKEPDAVTSDQTAEPAEEELHSVDNAVEAAPVAPETVDGQTEETAVDPVEETRETPAAHNPFCEELIREGITHSRKIIRLLYVMLGLIVVAMLIGALYLGYKIGTGVLEQKTDSPEKPAAKVVVVKAKPAVVKPVAAAETTDTAQTQEKTASEQEQKVDSASLMQAEYDKDVRVRTGAYRIVGLSKVVTVQAGQTFEGICRAHFGDGMECYVEAFNGGKRDFKTGDEIKIPLLKLKKRMNR